jgi:hypothetical protein
MGCKECNRASNGVNTDESIRDEGLQYDRSNSTLRVISGLDQTYTTARATISSALALSKTCHSKAGVDHKHSIIASGLMASQEQLRRSMAARTIRAPPNATLSQATALDLRMESQRPDSEQGNSPPSPPSPVKSKGEDKDAPASCPDKKFQSATHLLKPKVVTGGFGGAAPAPALKKPNRKREPSSVVNLPSLPFDVSYLVQEKTVPIRDAYEELYTLGKGTFGEVWKVRHKGTGKLFALKTISKNRCEKLDNIKNEIEILKSLVDIAIDELGSSEYR